MEENEESLNLSPSSSDSNKLNYIRSNHLLEGQHKKLWKSGEKWNNKIILICVFVFVNSSCLIMGSAAKLPAPVLENENKKAGAAGNIGCLFGKSLCDQDTEWCFDDYAFGRCLPTTGVIDDKNMYRYELSKGDMHALERQMERLFAMGYRWGHSYTQCVLQNLLESFKQGVELDESVCLDVQDQDLEGALKAFQEDIDPWNLAFIKFSPSAKNPNSDFADESYKPPKELSHLSNGELVTGKELLAKETPTLRIQDRLRQPVLEFSSVPESKLLEEAENPYLVEQELTNTVEKVKGNKKPKGKNKNGKNKNKNTNNKPINTKKSVLNVEYPGQSDNFNGVDIGSAKKNPSESQFEQWERNFGRGNLLKSLMDRKLEVDADTGVNSNGLVNERILQPKIFSSYYNTPDNFRLGFDESWNEEALGNGNGAGDFDLMGLDEGDDGTYQPASVFGGGLEGALGYGDDDRYYQGSREGLRLGQEEEDQQIQEAVAKLQAAVLLQSLLIDSINSENGFRNGEPEEQQVGVLNFPEFSKTEQEILPSGARGIGSSDPQQLSRSSTIYSDPSLDDGNLLYTEGGLVFLNNPENTIQSDQNTYPINLEDEGLNFLKRFIDSPPPSRSMQEGEENSPWSPLQLQQVDDGESLVAPIDTSDIGYGNEFVDGFDYNGSPHLFLLNRKGRNGFGFERRERLDVKKPGPWYRTVNNYAFDKDDNKEHKAERSKMNMEVNPEFGAAEGPADMIPDAPAENHQQGERIPEWQDQQQVNKKSAPVNFDKTFPIPFSGLDDGHLDIIDTSYANIFLDKSIDWKTAKALVESLAYQLDLDNTIFKEITVSNDIVTFKVEPNDKGWNASEVARRIQNYTGNILEAEMGVKILRADAGIRANSKVPSVMALYEEQDPISNQIYVATFAVCGLVAAVLVAAVAIFMIRKHSKSRDKLARLSQDDPNFEACKDYQDLCRARMAGSKNNEKMEPLRGPAHKIASKESENGTSSSRSEEPVLTNMDISTGHMVLSYMEDHLKNRDKMDQEWASLCAYEADPCSTAVAEKSENSKKNRYSNSLPFDHSRVILNDLANVSGSDFINASTITDHDPRNPAYIATQGPLPNTSADFWQMVWEQGSVVIVNLTRLTENTTPMCHRYWPDEGSELHHIYEVHLVSEHIWCDEYLVRSFYLKNLKTGETRTVTQFHFLAWPENGIPQSTKALLEFRRKVNKSYRGRSCPIIVHCSDGAGRTGTYCLIDMVLNRMTKGAKEIDIAASLEHIRDQRPGMVRSKQQFEFVLMAVAEEVHAILKALPQ